MINFESHGVAEFLKFNLDKLEHKLQQPITSEEERLYMMKMATFIYLRKVESQLFTNLYDFWYEEISKKLKQYDVVNELVNRLVEKHQKK